MGGFRCSYRTCTSKSDKTIHMFHYPVFDKIRCHQWITNAQKLNFLDLKLSQLKNRVVCEYHFTDDAFMNATKRKLKNTAVPTEDGPYCTKDTNADTEGEDAENPINLDDIENDYLTNMEKRARFSVKYGDFLTNDLTEPITLTPNKVPSLRFQDKGQIFNRITRSQCWQSPRINHMTYYTMDSNMTDVKPMKFMYNHNIALSDASTLFQNKMLPNPKLMAIEYEDLNANTVEQDCGQSNMIPKAEIVQKPTTIPNNKKVKIISEKKISEPFRIKKGELQPLSPSLVLKAPDKKKKPNVEVNGQQIHTLFIDLTNPQQVDNMQEQNICSIVSTQPPAPEQMCLNEYAPQLRVGDQIDFSNQNIELLSENSKPMENITTDNIDKMNLKNGLDLLNDFQNISVVPIEYMPNSSSNAPCVFTLPSDVPQDTTLPTSSSCRQHFPTTTKDVQSAPILSIGPEIVSCFAENANRSDVSKYNTLIDSKISNNNQILLNKHLPSLLSNPSPNKNVMKSKMPPEKLAAIEEKRKYNMKLRDIINSCLTNIEEPQTTRTKSSPAKKNKLNEKKVGEYLSKDPRLPSSQENNIAYLEARLQRMEDTLLNKIDQNSQKIADLKRTIKPLSGKTSVFTQTPLNPESSKRNLYQQISQYLSPEANSLIYEELFLNDYVDMCSNTESSTKKRRRKI